jgi:hypothetical protein
MGAEITCTSSTTAAHHGTRFHVRNLSFPVATDAARIAEEQRRKKTNWTEEAASKVSIVSLSLSRSLSLCLSPSLSLSLSSSFNSFLFFSPRLISYWLKTIYSINESSSKCYKNVDSNIQLPTTVCKRWKHGRMIIQSLSFSWI